MGGSNGEPQDLTKRLVDGATRYRIEVSTEESKIMTNSTNNIGADFSMNGQKLEGVTSFNYLGAIPVQGWHLLNRSPHHECLSNGCNGHTKQDLAMQHH